MNRAAPPLPGTWGPAFRRDRWAGAMNRAAALPVPVAKEVR